MIEWRNGKAEPAKCWLSTLPEDTTLATLVNVTKLRRRIERDYEEFKSELGLALFEGRGWIGCHHDATLCIAAYSFLIHERAAISPSAAGKRQTPALPDRPQPRGSPHPARASCIILDRYRPTKDYRRHRQVTEPMSLLPSATKSQSIL